MHKKPLLLLAFGALFSCAVRAQELKPAKRSDCYRKMVRLLINPDTDTKFTAKLRQIMLAKSMETDPEKLKILETQEKQEKEKMKDEVEQFATRMCSHLPE